MLHQRKEQEPFAPPILASVPQQADDGPSTPPPEEQTFTDDDGTVYSWDPATRKFLPRGQGGPGGAAVQYNPEDMVFEGEELDIPDFVRPGDEVRTWSRAWVVRGLHSGARRNMPREDLVVVNLGSEMHFEFEAGSQPCRVLVATTVFCFRRRGGVQEKEGKA